MSDVRERRAARVRHQRWKDFLPHYGKYILVAVVLVAALGAAATWYQPPVGKRFAHDHASFAVFIEGERVIFVHPDYDAGKRGMGPPHMHVGDGREVWHIEGSFPGGKPDMTLPDLFIYHGVKVREGSLQLDTAAGHNGTTWNDQGNKTWQLYVSRHDGDRRAPFVVEAFTTYRPQNLDKLLITYGDLTSDELTRQQATVPTPPGEPGG